MVVCIHNSPTAKYVYIQQNIKCFNMVSKKQYIFYLWFSFAKCKELSTKILVLPNEDEENKADVELKEERLTKNPFKESLSILLKEKKGAHDSSKVRNI